MLNSKSLKKGSENLLINCANLSSSDKLLIISEDKKFQWYDNDVALYLYKEAKNFGIRSEFLNVGEPDNENKDQLKSIMSNFDCTIFFARMGDQDRFEKNFFKTKRVMSYIKNIKSLASSFACVNHLAMLEIKKIINDLIFNSHEIEITCPLGTKVHGTVNKNKLIEDNEVGVIRFPTVVNAPVLADNFTGEVCLSKYLTSTGSKVYKPDYLKLEDPIIVSFNKGKIEDFIGKSKQVSLVKNHYEYVSKGLYSVTTISFALLVNSCIPITDAKADIFTM